MEENKKTEIETTDYSGCGIPVGDRPVDEVSQYSAIPFIRESRICLLQGKSDIEDSDDAA